MSIPATPFDPAPSPFDPAPSPTYKGGDAAPSSAFSGDISTVINATTGGGAGWLFGGITVILVALIWKKF